MDPAGAPVLRTDVDGVPVIGVASPGPTRGGLVFRVGVVDEPTARRGITHLVEHLAVSALGPLPHPHNGFTGPRTTGFYAEGSDDEVASYLAGICRSLVSLPFARFEAERRVLVAESLNRIDHSVVTALLGWRYGIEGWGGLDMAEVGLPTLDPATLQAWSATWFTAGNAVAWVAAPDPAATLRELPLPPGPPRPSLEQAAVLPQFPAWCTQRVAGPGLAMVADRSHALRASIAAVAWTAEERLRRDRGVVYSVSSTYEPMTATRVHLHFGADAMPEHHQEVVDGIVAAVSEVYTNGPPATFLAMADRMAAQEPPPEHMVGWVVEAAGRLLDGVEPESAEELRRRSAELDGPAIQAALAEAWPSSLLMVPEATTAPAPFVPAPQWSDPVALVGRSFASLVHPGQRIVALGWGLALEIPGQGQVVIRRDACPLVLCWDDGGRVVHGRDGFRLSIRPTEWQGGQELIGIIDAFASPDRYARRGESSGPATPPVAAAAPTKPWRSTYVWAVLLAVLAVTMVIGGVSLVVDPRTETDRVDGAVSLAMAAGLGVGSALLWRSHRRSSRAGRG